MPLVIGKDKTKTKEFRDVLVGVRMVVKYRRPNADEQIAFQTDVIRREGDEIINDRHGAALRHMRPAIVSFSFPDLDKAICIEDNKGKLHPLSRVKEDPGFNKHWYALLLEYVPSIMIELGAHIFGAVLERDPEKEDGDTVSPKKPPKKKAGGKANNVEEEAPN